MDPALWELLRAEEGTDGDRVLEAIIRFARPGIEIPGVRIVSRFGTIATCRIRARDVIPVRALSEVISVKAALRLSAGFEPAPASPDLASLAWPGERATDVRRGPALGLTGAGVVVAAVDWGVDVDSAAFRWPDDPAAADAVHEAGATRLLSFWDQRDQAVGPRPDPYGYGTVHSREEIDRALQDPRPYERLGYHPAIADRSGRGSHGTRTVDIAAGNGQGGGPDGIAPDADLIFVHLADRNTGGLANFGDSVRLLEAVDFISRTAGAQPCVINISAGRICGPKDGTTLVERALDELLAAAPGRFVVNSAGNYFGWHTHSCGTIAPGEARSLTFAVAPTDVTANELEIWYGGADEFAVRIDPPGYTGGRPVRLGERSDLLIEGRVIGRVYHREHDPNNGDNHIVAYLDPIGRAGNWTVTLEARRVSSGRFHAWIERDDTCPGCQARFTHDDSDPATTIGSIATSHLPLIVGAYDGHDSARPVAAFSSAGPGRDGRCLLPNLVAPGVDVLTARSAPVGASHNPGLLTRGKGTSFAAPHVTGAVALCFEAAGNRLSAHEIRSLVLGSCDPVPDPGPGCRLGHGYLNIPRLIADTQQALAAPTAVPGAEEPTMDTDDTIVLLAAAPATAYREYLYRPRGDLARWIGDHYDVVARPGQHVSQAVQEGDVLLEVTLGHMSWGRCTALTAGDLEFVASRPMPPGHLLLRPRRQVETSAPLPVEPAAYGVPGSNGGPGEEPNGGAEFGEAAPPAPPLPPAPPPPPHPAAPAPPPAPTPGGAVAAFTAASGDRDMKFDSFYSDDRSAVVAKAAHPRKTFYNRFNHFTAAPPSDATIQVATGQLDLTNPLNSAAVSTVLLQKFDDLGTHDGGVRTHFDESRPYFIFVPTKVKDASAKATPDKKAAANVSLFYGVEPEINLFGLCSFFENADDAVLITVPGIELWTGYGTVPWGIGITDAMIRSLFDHVGLQNTTFRVLSIAGYSTGYRGVNLTVINKLVDLSALRRLVYFDAFYRHDDHPLAAKGSAYFHNNTRWAVDTAIAASGQTQVVIYGATTGGTPRQVSGNEPRAPLKQIVKDHPGRIAFVDLEFPRDKKPALMDHLERICLARLVQGGIDDYFQEAAVPADVLDLVKALPARGTFSTFGRAGFTDLYAWVKSAPGKDLLARFSDSQARRLVAKFRLLNDWTDTTPPGSPVLSWYEMRHREFVQEIGKEAILP